MKEMIELIYENLGSLPSWGVARQPVDNLISQALPDQELINYLERFNNRGSIDLDDILEDIYNSEGELQRPEKIFLLMNQIKKVYLKT